ncbi:MAG: RNA polymerase sigma factor [Raineya sp.]|nr:RNA polymerase sigma factor [Raineya sp.]
MNVLELHQNLIEACKQGNRKAQYEIYKLYAKSMYAVAMRILNHQGEAEDILQEAFLEAFQKIHTFRQEASWGSWLKKIVINKALNLLKKRKITFQSYNYENFDLQDENPTEKEQIEWETENLEKIHHAIQLLPDGFRAVFTLYYLENLSHKEIAQMLEISESTSKSQLNRAKNKLKQILQNL